MTDLPDIHDTTDAEHWRGLTIDELLADMAEQLDSGDGAPVDDDYVTSVAGDVLLAVSEDVMDHAIDQAGCGKPDECRAKSVFLTWLAWNLDARLSPASLA